MGQYLTGLLLGVIVALPAYWTGALSRSGALAAALCGGLIFGLGGWNFAALLLTFFITSSLLSRVFARRKTAVGDNFSKGSQRDWGQVLANGGLGTLLAVLYALQPTSPWIWIAFTGAMAAVNADTWATEIGVLSKSPPRLVTSGRRVEPGTSGAVSLGGSLAALAGASLVGLVAVLFSGANWNLCWIAALAGSAGSFFDSILGATLQAIYYCPSCQKETERHPDHTCGAQTSLVRGWHRLDNDWVNFACSLVGAGGAVLFWLVSRNG